MGAPSLAIIANRCQQRPRLRSKKPPAKKHGGIPAISIRTHPENQQLSAFHFLLRRLKPWRRRLAMVGLAMIVVARALRRLRVHRPLEFLLPLAHALVDLDEASAKRPRHRRQPVANEQDGNNAEDEPMHHAETTHCNLLPVDPIRPRWTLPTLSRTPGSTLSYADSCRRTNRVRGIPF